MKRFLIVFSRIFVGVLFIFSGLIKANDPLGFGYKLQEYYDVFHLGFLGNGVSVQAIFICALEIILGCMLLLGIRAKQTVIGLLVIIVFFTLLTFVSAVFKVVTSCGCFGDAIPLTPWQSFGKDLILLTLIIILFIYRLHIKPLFSSLKAQNSLLLIVSALSVGLGFFTYSFLPFIDFLPYKAGVNISEAMAIPPGASLDEFEIIYTLKNKKSGDSKEMTDKEYIKTEIWKDTSWEIIGEPKQKLIKKGFEPKIKDFIVNDAQGNDYTREILDNPYYSLVLVAYDLNKTNEHAIQKLNALAMNVAEDFNIRTICLTSASAKLAESFSKKNKLFYEMFYMDAVPLKSMVRANPGIILLRNGVIVNKWHYRTVPSYETMRSLYFEKD